MNEMFVINTEYYDEWKVCYLHWIVPWMKSLSLTLNSTMDESLSSTLNSTMDESLSSTLNTTMNEKFVFNTE